MSTMFFSGLSRRNQRTQRARAAMDLGSGPACCQQLVGNSGHSKGIASSDRKQGFQVRIRVEAKCNQDGERAKAEA